MPKKSNIDKLFKHLSETTQTNKKVVVTTQKTKETIETQTKSKKAENESKP